MTVKSATFLYKNYITSIDQLTVSSNTANRKQLINRNEETKFYAIGEGTGLTITWNPGSSKTINRIFLQNTNIKACTIKYNSNAVNFSPAISVSGNEKPNLYFEMSDQSVDDVTVTVTDTIDGGGVRIGQMYIGKELYEIATTIGGTLRHVPDVQQTINVMSDKTTQKVYVRRLRHYELGLVKVSTSNREYFETIYDENRRGTVVFVPYPATGADTWNGWAGHYNWVNAPDMDNYTRDLPENGYDINIVLQQACGVG